jgi:hypothetical protein
MFNWAGGLYTFINRNGFSRDTDEHLLQAEANSIVGAFPIYQSLTPLSNSLVEICTNMA